ncbi:TldD/PmbA family protein [Streptomyces chartreusis]
MTWQADGAVVRIGREVVSRARPGERVEAFVARGIDSQIVLREQTVESVTRSDSGGVGVRVIADGRVGFAYSGSLDPAALGQVLGDARDNAGYTDVRGDAVLPRPDGVPAADIDLWSEDCAALSTEAKTALSRELERAVTASAKIRGVKSVRWGDAAAESAVVSTEGVESYSRRTSCFVSTYVLGDPGTGGTTTSTGYTVGRSPAELDVAAAAREALAALPEAAHQQPGSQRLPVLFDPSVTAAFLAVVSGMLNNPATHPDQALAAAEPGHRVAPEHVTLVDDPTDPSAFGAARHDAEGLATRRNVLLDRGCLAQRLHDSSSGHRAGVPSTGSAVRAGYKSLPRAGARALSLVPGALDRAALLSDVTHGFLVQAISGLQAGTDPLSGRFSAAVSGRMVRHGELAEHVHHCTLASSIPEALGGLLAVGSDVRSFPSNARGMTVLIAEMSLGAR